MADSWLRRLLGPPDPSGRRSKPLSGAVYAAPAKTSRTNPYQAVGVVACPRACKAVGEASALRFLARQAPSLPLPGCDRAAQCRCRFEKFVDRRSKMQRAPYTNFGGVSFGGAEKRLTRGRRNTDR